MADWERSGWSQPLAEYLSISINLYHNALINLILKQILKITKVLYLSGQQNYILFELNKSSIYLSTIIFMLKFAKVLATQTYRQMITNLPFIRRKALYRPSVFDFRIKWNIHYPFCNYSNPLRDSEKTFQLVRQALEEKAQHAQQLEKSLNEDSPQFNNKMNKQQTRIQLAKLGSLLSIRDQIKATLQNISDLYEMIKETKDKSEKEILKQQISAAKLQLRDYQEDCLQLMVPPAPYDKADDVILQFRPGAGGAESSIFVQDISEMYQTFCSSQGWKCWVTNTVKQSGVSKGYKVLDMRVQGEGCHKILKCQSGVHKVIRIPETESKGRLHSSTISVVVMPVVPFTFQVDPKDIKYQYTRSSGPGGQAVNKVQSACRAIHIPSGLAVFIQQERSQQANKKRATEILKQKLFEIEYKKSVQQEQSKRKSQVTTLDRSEKIRTYNYPQDRITDHRTGLTKFGIVSMMRGEMLQEFIQSYIESVKEQKLDSLILQLYEQAGISPPKS